jgi:NAD+ kinase
MTPIAPHTLNTRSIIFSPDDVITVELGERKRQNQESGFASFDGYTSISIITGDRVVIKQMAASTKILKLNDLSFIEILRQKMRNN